MGMASTPSPFCMLNDALYAIMRNCSTAVVPGTVDENAAMLTVVLAVEFTNF